MESSTYKILFIHPTGNFHSNPNLLSILQRLSSSGFKIDYLCIDAKDFFYQKSPFQTLTVFKYYYGNKNNDIKEYFINSIKTYDLIIGTHDGIQSASCIAEKYSIPLVLLSYEMTFADEVGKSRQNREKHYCKNLSLAISQDPVRGFFLSREYEISKEIIVNIPVASSYRPEWLDRTKLKEKYGISPTKKVILMAGAISDRTMAGQLIDAANRFSDEWILVLNSYVPINKKKAQLFNNKFNNIVFLDEPIPSYSHIGSIMSIADIGISLNLPVYGSEYAQKNVVFMGLSSGKISTYLQYGIPVIVNEIGQISDYVRQFQLGEVIKGLDELNTDLLNEIYHRKLQHNCTNFFKSYLDFDLYYHNLITLLVNIIERKSLDKKAFDSINSITEFQISVSFLCQIENNYNNSKHFYESEYYNLGRKICNPPETLINAYHQAKRIVKSTIKMKLSPDGHDPNKLFQALVNNF